MKIDKKSIIVTVVVIIVAVLILALSKNIIATQSNELTKASETGGRFTVEKQTVIKENDVLDIYTLFDNNTNREYLYVNGALVELGDWIEPEQRVNAPMEAYIERNSWSHVGANVKGYCYG